MPCGRQPPLACWVMCGYSRPMGVFLSWLGRLLVAVGVLLLTGYLGYNASAYITTRATLRTGEAELRAAVPGAIEAVHTVRDDVIGSIGPPALSWTVQQCTPENRLGGWFVQSHGQQCAMRGVQAYPVRDRAEAVELATRVRGPAPAVSDDDPADGCNVLGAREAGRDPTQTVPAVAVLYLEPTASADGQRCFMRAVTGPDPAVPEIVLDGSHVPLAADRRWLVVEASHSFPPLDVGCMHWSVLFCNEVPGMPVFGVDPPG